MNLEDKINEILKKLVNIEGRLDKIDDKFDSINARIDSLESKRLIQSTMYYRIKPTFKLPIN